MQSYIEEKEVTLPLLEQLFQSAQYEASIQDDGNFMVLAETALVGVDVLTAYNQRFIRFTAMYGLKEAIPLEQKVAFANTLNNSVIFARFSVLDTDHNALNVVYHLPFWGGISSYHVIAAFRMFVHVYAGVPLIPDSAHLIEYGSYPSLGEPLGGNRQTH